MCWACLASSLLWIFAKIPTHPTARSPPRINNGSMQRAFSSCGRSALSTLSLFRWLFPQPLTKAASEAAVYVARSTVPPKYRIAEKIARRGVARRGSRPILFRYRSSATGEFCRKLSSSIESHGSIFSRIARCGDSPSNRNRSTAFPLQAALARRLWNSEASWLRRATVAIPSHRRLSFFSKILRSLSLIKFFERPRWNDLHLSVARRCSTCYFYARCPFPLYLLLFLAEFKSIEFTLTLSRAQLNISSALYCRLQILAAKLALIDPLLRSIARICV